VSPSIAALLKTARILWFALFASPAFFIAVLALQASRQVQRVDFEMSPQTQAVLYAALSVAIATTSVVLPHRQLLMSIRRLNLRVEDQVGEQVGSFRESAPVRRVVADPEAAVRAAMPSFQSTFIVGMALAEAVALFGLLFGYVGNPPLWCAPFFIVCWALMASKFPRVTQITGAIEAATGAECRLGS